MKSNDTILLEKAYEQILNGGFLKEDHHDGFEFKGADFSSPLKKALGEEVYSLPRQNFYDAIENENLKEGSWYIHSKQDGYNPRLYKIADLSSGQIYVEDEQRDMGQKEIAPATSDIDVRRGIKYSIFNPEGEEGSYRGGLDIRPNDIIVGPIEDEEVIYNIERYMDMLANRTKSMAAYFKDRPNAPLD
jgi:hypothetical protein